MYFIPSFIPAQCFILVFCTLFLLSGLAAVHTSTHRLTTPPHKTAFSLPCPCLCAQILRQVLFFKIDLSVAASTMMWFFSQLSLNIPVHTDQKVSKSSYLKPVLQRILSVPLGHWGPSSFWLEGTFVTWMCSVPLYFLLLKLSFSIIIIYFCHWWQTLCRKLSISRAGGEDPHPVLLSK